MKMLRRRSLRMVLRRHGAWIALLALIAFSWLWPWNWWPVVKPHGGKHTAMVTQG